jgi:hypothetical protein
MNKLTSLLIAGVSIAMGSFVAMPAQALAYIVDNPRPGKCTLIENDIVKKKCNAFKLSRVRDEAIDLNAFRFEFLFNDLNIKYIAVINENAKTVTTNDGRTFTVYPILLQTLEPKGSEAKITGVEGVCGTTPNYSHVMCQVSGSSYRSSYLYIGNPVSVQQNTENSQNSSSKSNQYVFNTNSHVDTGISVNRGDKINIQASGRIAFGLFVGSGGPKGILINPDYNYFVDILHGQLMGRIRKFGARDLDGWFPIGEGGEFVAQSQGVLEFAVNDNRPGDNSGSFRIELTIEPAK